MSDNRAIGVFDSGLGGLTVLSAIHKALPGESTVYLGDLARVPYGTKSPQTVVRYSLNTAKALLALGNIKMLVVACSTATAHALEALQDALSIPVIGTIEPGSQAALADKNAQSITVLATPGTVQSKAYEHTLRRLGYAGVIQQQACPLFVPIVEEGMISGPIASMVASHYLGFVPSDVDTVILGCTHYPALTPLLSGMMPPSVKWIDSNEATAKSVESLLREKGMLNESAFIPQRRYFVTDAAARLEQLSELFLEKRIERNQVEVIDL
jgi:glutamate racemase